jgi:uncharacterized protein YecE (DUF72 family)
MIRIGISGGSYRECRGSDAAAALARWAERIGCWAEGGRDVLVYFDNTMEGDVPVDAAAPPRLLERP